MNEQLKIMYGVDQPLVRGRFVYSEGGFLIWLASARENFSTTNNCAVWHSRYLGKVAGFIGPNGYRLIALKGRQHKAGRLIWLYHHGYWPEVIDHIDGDKANDKIENLRDTTLAHNSRNRAIGKSNKTGVIGVYAQGSLFRAQINYNGQRVRLGSFSTLVEAKEARLAAQAKYGFHPNHGRAA